jgi:hypothetical protein
VRQACNSPMETIYGSIDAGEHVPDAKKDEDWILERTTGYEGANTLFDRLNES